MKTFPISGVGLLAALAVLAGTVSLRAKPITVDVILANQPAGLSASVDMTVSGSKLIITLVNTSSGQPSSVADGLLTGLAFLLPNGLNINSGTVLVAAGSTVLGNINAIPGGNNVSGEWGYANAISGHFNDAALAVDTQVSTMQADTLTRFNTTPIDSPTGLSGPEYGLVSTTGLIGGLAAIRNAVVITLQLNQTPNATSLLASIQSGTVAVTFGSPGGVAVPDNSSTISLLGLAMLGIEGLRRRLRMRTS